MTIKLYEFECGGDCDVIMQVQTEKVLDGIIACMCGANMLKVFSTEIDESVFGPESDIIISEVEDAE
jgi:hypothetical protein